VCSLSRPPLGMAPTSETLWPPRARRIGGAARQQPRDSFRPRSYPGCGRRSALVGGCRESLPRSVIRRGMAHWRRVVASYLPDSTYRWRPRRLSWRSGTFPRRAIPIRPRHRRPRAALAVVGLAGVTWPSSGRERGTTPACCWPARCVASLVGSSPRSGMSAPDVDRHIFDRGSSLAATS